MRERFFQKKNSGFTLVETLAAVAILVVLLGISAVAVLRLQKYLEITRLDNAARGIYMAAQNRAVLLSGGKQLKALVQGEDNAVSLAARTGEEAPLYYVAHTAEKTDPALEQLLTAGSIDPALRQGEFYIVYEPVSGSVTDVFYVEKGMAKLAAGDFSAFYQMWSAAPRQERMKAAPMLGHYSGGAAQGEDIDTAATPSLTVMIQNEERLTVTVSRWLPNSLPSGSVQLAVALEYGGERISLYDDQGAEKNPFSWRMTAEPPAAEGRGKRDSKTWVLDELGTQRFAALFPGRSLELGELFAVEAVLTSVDGSFSEITARDDNNSLFAEQSSGSDTAYLEYLRHLQNLDEKYSGVGGDKTRAVQRGEIRCASNETYPGYQFVSIRNSSLKSFDGGQYPIRDLLVAEETQAGGLFSAVLDTDFTDVRLVNAAVSASGAFPAGALAGEATDASFDGCWVYWEPEQGELNLRSLLGSDGEGYQYKITGASAGGLVGRMRGGMMIDCLAATTLRGRDAAGGLIGTERPEVSGPVRIENSYADCYLAGNSAAGLIGDLGGAVQLEDCYAAGFIGAGNGSKAAGLCLGSGKTTAQNVYSALCVAGENGSVTYPPLTGGLGDSLQNTYRRGGDPKADEKNMTYEDMTAQSFSRKLGEPSEGGAFAWKTEAGSNSPYNLRERLNLVVYSFPGLASLPHYGDWNAEFKKPSLVYYEEYAGADGKSSYGFSGGNARYLIGELSDKETILLDGYAVALLQDDLKDDEMEVTYRYFDPADGAEVRKKVRYARPGKGDDQTPELVSTTWKNSEGNEGRYYLAPLPEELVNSRTAEENLYRYLSFSFMPGPGEEEAAGEYFYNPHFAETVIPYQPEDGQPHDWEAGEAKDYAGELVKNRGTVSVRTPRHLYSLSQFPEYYHSQAHNLTFRQELDLDYGTYTGYSLFGAAGGVFRQQPIGRESEPFKGSYNGGCNTISRLIFTVPEGSGRSYAGLFGFSEGVLRNIVYQLDPNLQVDVKMDNGSQSLYIGGLLGGNTGTVQNCAVSGASLIGRNTGSTLYIGGLAGRNRGIIRECGAEAATLSADNATYAKSYVGGVVGENTSSGRISATYGVGRLTAEVDGTSQARVCGFAGYNSGVINSSYAAADLRSSGQGVETYGFCGVREGSQSGTLYLNQGNFTYRGISYNANYTRHKASPVDYETLAGSTSAVAGMSKVDGSGAFPYPTAVKDAGGAPVHYGQWPSLMELGEMGAYYWEKLELNKTETYYVELLSVDPQKSYGNRVSRLTTLSTAHDDGGVVTGYGYGYYEKQGTKDTLTAEGLYYTDGRTPALLSQSTPSQGEVDQALAVLMPGYTFHSYHTYIPDSGKAGLYPNNKPGSPNVRLTLSQGTSVSVTFALNPHFGGALAVEKVPSHWSVAPALREVPGSAANPYQVRSVEQLEFINWNSQAQNTRTVIQAAQAGRDMANFPYLTSSLARTAGKHYWLQSHDLDGKSREYTPIAEYYDHTGGNTGNLYGWFGGSYDGADYIIKNVSIQGQQSSCAGLFGIVYGGTLKNMILHDSNGAGVINSGYYKGITSSSKWYAIGALAGLAAEDPKGEGKVENCAVSGYTINAKVYTAGSWGGSGIGGLLGISRMDLKNCSAITNIQVPKGTQDNDNMRVGGLAGICQKSITSCYTGGSIDFDGSIPFNQNTGSSFPKGAYIGGIVGGSYMKPLKVGDSAEVIGITGGDNTNNALTNCYSFVELPSLTDRNGQKANPYIRALYAIGGTGDVYTVRENNELDRNHSAANRGTCTIQNCYYLGSSTLKNNGRDIQSIRKNRPANDPLSFKTDVFDTNGINYSNTAQNNDARNPNVTQLTYRQLARLELVNGKDIYTLLPEFRPVTTEVDGLSVSGKYSYPPSRRAELEGLDYPFPTILTREQGAYQVHYGEWPAYGVSRPEGGRPIALDLFTATPHSETLALTDVPPGGRWAAETDPEDQKAIQVEMEESTGRLTVSPLDVGTTKLLITYTELDGQTAHHFTLTVNITAELELRPNTAAVFQGGSTVVQVTPYSAGTPLPLSSLELVAVVCDEVTCQVTQAVEQGAKKPAITLTGRDPCETMANISFTCTAGGNFYPGLSPLTITVLPLPEPKKAGDSCQLDFGSYSGGYGITGLAARLQTTASPAPAKVTVADKTITLSEIQPDVRELPLEITLTMEGRSHVIQMTAVVG